VARRRRRDLPLLELAAVRPDPDHRYTVRAVFILDGLAALGDGGLVDAGQDLAGQLAVFHPGARLSWRLIGAGAATGAGPDARQDGY
jgi:hypothetical protein